jgi:hypothetical protein
MFPLNFWTDETKKSTLTTSPPSTQIEYSNIIIKLRRDDEKKNIKNLKETRTSFLA